MKIDREQLIKVIDFWQGSLNLNVLCQRDIIESISYTGKEIVDLVGPRRAGKSSIMKLIVERLKLKEADFLYINFEDPFFIENNNPIVIEEIVSVFREYYNPKIKYLFLDEIQEIQGWEKAIRKFRDGENFKIFLTGSSSKLLSKELATLLTGRHKSYAVLPLSFKEFLNFRKINLVGKKDIIIKSGKIRKQFTDFLQLGGFPEPVLTGDEQLLKNYFYDILQKDVMARYQIRERETLEKIAIYILSNIGKSLSIESLKQTFNISFSLATKYVAYLQEAFLVFGLTQFSFSLKKQTKAFKKIYAIDTGLANAVSFRFSQDKGRYLENVVFLELIRRKEKIYYYKTKNNLEVDFAIFEKQKINGLLQVAWSLGDESTAKRERNSLLAAMEESGLEKGLILTYDEQDRIKTDDKIIEIIPVWKWLLEVE